MPALGTRLPRPAAAAALAAAALVLLTAGGARAGGVTAATVGTSSAQVVAAPTAGPGWRYVQITNDSGSNAVACAFDNAAVLNGAGSWTMPPLALTGASSNVVTIAPAQPVAMHHSINCIAAGAATPVTIVTE